MESYRQLTEDDQDVEGIYDMWIPEGCRSSEWLGVKMQVMLYRTLRRIEEKLAAPAVQIIYKEKADGKQSERP